MPVNYQEDDGSVLSRMQQRVAQDNFRAQQVDQQFVANLSSYQAAYPTASPDAFIGFAKAGLAVNDPTVQKAMLQYTQKKQKSGLFNRLGDVIGGAAHVVGHAIGAVTSPIAGEAGALTRGTVRSALVALETPLQEVQDFSRAALYESLSGYGGGSSLGSVNRNFGAALQQSGTSSGVEALSALARGDKVDLGTGFLPGGDVEKKVKAAAGRLQLKIGDQIFGGPGNPAITLGRVVGATVTEPGSQPFKVLSGLIDGAVSWYADPVAALGSAAKEAEVGGRLSRGLSAARDEGLVEGVRELANKPTLATIHADTSMGSATRQAAHTLLGMIPGHRPTTIPEVTEGWLTKGGGRVIQHIADENDPLTIYRAMNRNLANPNVSVTIANELAEAGTPQQVSQVLRSHLGSDITQSPEWLGFKAKTAGKPGVRLLGMMPADVIDPHSLEDVLNQTDRLFRSGKASPELRDTVMRRLMAAPDAQSVAPIFFDGLARMADEMAPKLRVGLKPEAGETAEEFVQRVADRQQVKAGGLVRSFATSAEKLRTYLGDEITANDKAAGVTVAGEQIPAQTPYQMLEFLNTVIPTPNARNLRTATATLGRLVDNPLFAKTTGMADTLMHYWKPLTIIKPALATRLIGEHQAEMAGMGLDSFWSHPISFVSALISNPEDSRAFMESAREHPTELLKHPFKAAEAAGSKVAQPFVGNIRQGDVLGRMYNEGGEDALKGLLSGMRTDAQDLAGVAGPSLRGQRLYTMHDGAAYTKAWHSSLTGIYEDDVWRRVAESKGNLNDVKQWFWGEGQGLRQELAKRLPLLDTPTGSDAYIESLWRGAMYRTGGDPAVMDAVATGMFDGERLGGLDDKGVWSLSDKLKAHLDHVVGPESVKGSVTYGGTLAKKAYFDDTMNYLFDHLLQRPFEQLVESPALRQNYWDRIEQQLPFMDASTRAAALENAAKDGIGPGAGQLKRMRTVTEGTGQITSLEDAHSLALKHALNETKKVLYDQTNKSQFFDAMRTVFPFGEAWRQAMKRWGKIAWNNPNTVVGGQKIVTGLEGNGFFHKDENGDEVFNMPFGRNISKMALGLAVPVLTGHSSQGASIDLTSRAAGLSMMADILPGVGPVFQVGAGAIIPDTPDWSWAKDFISPHGQQDYTQGVLESSMPGFVKSLMQVVQAGNPRQFAGAVSDAANGLAATGKYDLSDPTGAEQNRMLGDAKAIAKGTFMLRAFGQALAPSSPLPVALAKVKDGHLIEQAMLAQEFNKWVSDPNVGYDGAIQRFIDKYGEDAFVSTQGKTLALTPRLPLSSSASGWEESHPGVVKDYNLVWGLFAPQGKEQDFDYAAYQRQLKRGDRAPINATERIQLANRHIAGHIYAVQAAKVGATPTPEQRVWLAQVRQVLIDKYPGYARDIPGLPSKAPPDMVIAQLARAVVDPRVSKTPAAKAAALYLQKRQEAIAAANQLGATSQGGNALSIQAAGPLRAWLANIGAVLSQQTPAFAPFFDSLFAQELT